MMRIKRYLNIFLTAAVLFSILAGMSIQASAAVFSGATPNGLKWESDGISVTITGYDGEIIRAYPNGPSAGDITIPGSVDVNGTEQKVTAIGDNAFYLANIDSLIIPNGVITIGSDLLYSSPCKSVTLPDSLTTIADNAFYKSSLESAVIPNSVTHIGKSAFESSFLKSLTLSNNLETISEKAFSHVALTELTIPNGVKTIGKSAFSGCGQLTSISLPDSLTAIEEEAFAGCYSLSSITIPGSVATIGDDAFKATNANNITDKITIIGVKGSAAQIYADANDNTVFQELDAAASSSLSASAASPVSGQPSNPQTGDQTSFIPFIVFIVFGLLSVIAIACAIHKKKAF